MSYINNISGVGITIIILVAIISDYVINSISDYLNLRIIRDELPKDFNGIFDQQEYRKSQEYLRVNTRFGWIQSTFNLALILIFWFFNGFSFIDYWIRLLELGSIITGILYICILLLLKYLISIPFSLYSTFVIEERFGFNKTTWSIYISDLIKSIIIAALLGIPLIASILIFFENAGENAWWMCWGILTLFMFGVQFLAPTFIMPLFNKFTPIEEGKLKQAIFSYAESINYSLDNVMIMDGSKRSAKSNAYFTGFGKHKRIVLFDTLIKQLSVPELVAVLAHEMGHFKKHHIMKMALFGVIQSGLMFFILSFFIYNQGLFDAFFMKHQSVYAGLIFFGMLYFPVDFFFCIILQIYSRKNEYEADKFAVTTTGDSENMVNALKKISIQNLSNLVPHPLYVFLNYSHPPILERLAAIKNKF